MAITRLVDERIGPLQRADVVVEDEARLVAAVLRPRAEREDDDDRQRQDQQDEVPQRRPARRAASSAGRSGAAACGRLVARGAPRRSIAGIAVGLGLVGCVSRRCADLNSSQMSIRCGVARRVLGALEVGDDLVRREDRRVGQDRRVDELLGGVVRRRVQVEVRLLGLDLGPWMKSATRRRRRVGRVGEDDPGVHPEQRALGRDAVAGVAGVRHVARAPAERAGPAQGQRRLAVRDLVAVVSESRARTCGATSSRIWRASSSSAGSTELSE